MKSSKGLIVGTLLLIVSILFATNQVNGQRHQTMGGGGGGKMGGGKSGGSWEDDFGFEEKGSKGKQMGSQKMNQGSQSSKMYKGTAEHDSFNKGGKSSCQKGQKCWVEESHSKGSCQKGQKCYQEPPKQSCRKGQKCWVEENHSKGSCQKGQKCYQEPPKPPCGKGQKCGGHEQPKKCNKGEKCDTTNIIIIEKKTHAPPPPPPQEKKVIIKKDVQVVNNNQKTIINQNTNNNNEDRLDQIKVLIVGLERRKNECLQRFLALRRKALYYFNLAEELRQRAVAQAAERDRLLALADQYWNLYLQLQEQARALKAQIREIEGELQTLVLEQQNLLTTQDIVSRSVEADTATARADAAAANRAIIEAEVDREIAANAAAAASNTSAMSSDMKRQALEAERDAQAAQAQADQFERQAKELLRTYRRLLMESNKQQKIAALQQARSQAFSDRALFQERLASALVGGLENLNNSVRSGQLRQIELVRSIQQLAAFRDFALNDTNSLKSQLDAIEDQQGNALKQFKMSTIGARDQAIQVSKLTTLANIFDNKAELTSDLAKQSLRCVIQVQRELFAIKNVYIWGKWWYVFRRFYPVCANRCAAVGQQYGYNSQEFLTCLRRCMCYNKGRYLSSMFSWDDQNFGENYNNCYESQNWNERFAIFQQQYSEISVEDQYMNTVLGPTLHTRGARLMNCDKNYWNYWFVWYLRFNGECKTQCENFGATAGYNSSEYKECLRTCLCSARCDQLGDIFNWTSTEVAMCRDNCDNSPLWFDTNLGNMLDNQFGSYAQEWWYIFKIQFPGNCTQFGVGTDEYRQCIRLGFCHNRCVTLGQKQGWTPAQITLCEQQCNADPYARTLTRFGIERRNLNSFCQQNKISQCPDLV